MNKQINLNNIIFFTLILFGIFFTTFAHNLKSDFKLKKSNLIQLKNKISTCGHAKMAKVDMKPVELYGNMSQQQFLQMRTKQEWAPIRIHVDYSVLNSQSKQVSAEKISVIREVMDKSVKVLEKLLRVKPLINLLNPGFRAQRYIPFSEEVKKNGINADLLLLVQFHDSVTGSTAANAAAYEYDSRTGRPIVGLVQFNKNLENIKNSANSLLSLALHEITHVLVFSNNLFDKFIDAKGNKIPLDKVVGHSQVNGDSRKKLITPRVVAAAREHFGCNTIDGMEIENQGGEGTAASHWEERLMYGDYMVGETIIDPSISEITLGLFDDSGWYKTNPYTGGLFRFGLKKGCSLLNEKCVQDEKTKFKNEYCVVENEKVCSPSHLSKAFCTMDHYKDPLPVNNRYFKDIRKGGWLLFADDCPVPIRGYNKSDKMQGNCNVGSLDGDFNVNPFENYGSQSACFVSSVIPAEPKFIYNWENKTGFSAGCYRYSCNHERRAVVVSIAGESFICPTQGGPIVLKNSKAKGTVHCMDYNLMCNQTKECSDIFECATKESRRRTDLQYDYKSLTVNSGGNTKYNII